MVCKAALASCADCCYLFCTLCYLKEDVNVYHLRVTQLSLRCVTLGWALPRKALLRMSRFISAWNVRMSSPYWMHWNRRKTFLRTPVMQQQLHTRFHPGAEQPHMWRPTRSPCRVGGCSWAGAGTAAMELVAPHPALHQVLLSAALWAPCLEFCSTAGLKSGLRAATMCPSLSCLESVLRHKRCKRTSELVILKRSRSKIHQGWLIPALVKSSL